VKRGVIWGIVGGVVVGGGVLVVGLGSHVTDNAVATPIRTQSSHRTTPSHGSHKPRESQTGHSSPPRSPSKATAPLTGSPSRSTGTPSTSASPVTLGSVAWLKQMQRSLSHQWGGATVPPLWAAPDPMKPHTWFVLAPLAHAHALWWAYATPQQPEPAFTTVSTSLSSLTTAQIDALPEPMAGALQQAYDLKHHLAFKLTTTVPPTTTTTTVTVTATVPSPTSISTLVSKRSITLGGAVSDVASVTVNGTDVLPSGLVHFYECGPGSSSCTPSLGTPLPPGEPLVGGVATSASFTPQTTGTYCFAASYVPGSSLFRASTESGTTTNGECVTVTAATATAIPSAPTGKPWASWLYWLLVAVGGAVGLSLLATGAYRRRIFAVEREQRRPGTS